MGESSPAASPVAIFPHIVSGGGYTTQVILFGPQGTGWLVLMSKDGASMD